MFAFGKQSYHFIARGKRKAPEAMRNPLQIQTKTELEERESRSGNFLERENGSEQKSNKHQKVKSTRADIEKQKHEEIAKSRVRKVDSQGRAYDTGKRKCSLAPVWIEPGEGKFVINDKKCDVYFPMLDQRAALFRPLSKTNALRLLDRLLGSRLSSIESLPVAALDDVFQAPGQSAHDNHLVPHDSCTLVASDKDVLFELWADHLFAGSTFDDQRPYRICHAQGFE
ncbi:hypothetical protein LXL04_007298 [Taraxacum kok-saghyz]